MQSFVCARDRYIGAGEEKCVDEQAASKRTENGGGKSEAERGDGEDLH